MTEELLDLILGSLLILFGILVLVLKVQNSVTKEESASSKSVHYQFIILAVGLIIMGLIMI